jgi:hypothetical protein
VNNRGERDLIIGSSNEAGYALVKVLAVGFGAEWVPTFISLLKISKELIPYTVCI